MKRFLLFVALLVVALRLVKAQVLDIEAFQAPTLSLPIIVGLALIDSINPCVIGVLILLLTVLLKAGNKRAIITNGTSYVAGVYVTYLVGGLTLLGVFNLIRNVIIISQFLYFVVGILIIIAGFLEIKDFFWYGRWYSLAIPARFVKYIEKKAAGTHASLLASFTFGVALTLIELPCTGAPYLAVLTLMSQGGYAYVTAMPLLLFYNLVFVLPLLVIIYLAYTGLGMKKLESWRHEHKGKMRLCTGVALLAIGVWILTAVAEYMLWPSIIISLLIMTLMAVVKYALKK